MEGKRLRVRREVVPVIINGEVQDEDRGIPAKVWKDSSGRLIVIVDGMPPEVCSTSHRVQDRTTGGETGGDLNRDVPREVKNREQSQDDKPASTATPAKEERATSEPSEFNSSLGATTGRPDVERDEEISVRSLRESSPAETGSQIASNQATSSETKNISGEKQTAS
uniref:Uncharacterized protein n=1 Tax=Lotharella oceanica TaxID=641309 RepID=A0A7S2TU37_9EUKA